MLDTRMIIAFAFFFSFVSCQKDCIDELPHMCGLLRTKGTNSRECVVFSNIWSSYCKATCTQFCDKTTASTTNTPVTSTTPSTTAATSTSASPSPPSTAATTSTSTTSSPPSTTSTIFTKKTTTVITIPTNLTCGDREPFCLSLAVKDTESLCGQLGKYCLETCDLCQATDGGCSNLRDENGYDCSKENCQPATALERFRVFQRCSQYCCMKGEFHLPA